MTIDARALLQTLEETPAQSGSALAERFGVTRAAIWKQVESLRLLGAPIVAKAGQGYRLCAPLDLLAAGDIQARLHELAAESACSIDVLWQIDSTSSEMMRRAQAGEARTSACFAELQSAGRGRRGRAWHTPLGGGLAFSLLQGFDSAMSSLAGLSLVAGIGVVRALADLGYRDLGLKWPNDVQAGGRKLAGILIELGGDALGPCHAVLGIGINVHLALDAGERIDQPWTDLSRLSVAQVPARNRLAAQLLFRLLQVLDQFRAQGFSSFVAEFAQYDVLRGHSITIINGQHRSHGVAIGVDGVGILRVATADGEILVNSGEVSVRAVSGTLT
jgi:BirA family transcriptional regulator, biotin operon repressor / biotin---[acetyl-CoA-carboxylase] ligase